MPTMGAMPGLVRALTTAVATAVLIAVGMVAAAPPASAASPSPAPLGSSLVGSVLAAPHLYSGGGVLSFGAPSLAAPTTFPSNSVLVAHGGQPGRHRRGQGYWLASADGGVYAVGNAGSTARSAPCTSRGRSWRWRPRPTGGATGWPPWTAGCSRSATLLLRFDGGDPPQSADRRHGVDRRRQGLLAGGCRRRSVRLRRRPVPRVDGRNTTGVAGDRHGPHRQRARLLAGGR